MGSILVTGSNGFIGKNLRLKFSDFDKKVYFPSSKECNLKSLKRTLNYFDKINPEFVIHLAGDSGGIGYLKSNPALVFNNNTMITSNLFSACKEQKTNKLIILNSINVYPKDATAPFTEKSIFDGDPEDTILPYGLSKKLSLYYSRFYFEQFGLKSLNLICDNVYGEFDNFDDRYSRVIPANIQRILEAKIKDKQYIKCWGSGNPLRSFIHVDDVCRAIIFFMNQNFNFDYVNLGQKNLTTIRSLINQIASYISYNGRIEWDIEKPDGQLERYMDLKKLKSYGFKTKIDLGRGLERTIEWYKNFRKVN